MKTEYKTENDLLQIVEESQIDLFLENKFVGSPSNQEEIESIVAFYQEFESKHPIKVINQKQFNTPVNFKQAKLFPRHRWYTYKEGFSPQFVEDFINRFATTSKNIVFDPFGGIGTTVLQGSMLNYQSFSNDINPLSNYVALVKTDSYTKKDIIELNLSFENLIQTDLKLKSKPPINETVTSYFTSETLDSILKIQNWIYALESNKIRNVFSIALLTILESLSTHKKDGNGVKKKKSINQIFTVSDIKELIGKQINLFIVDIETTSIKIKPVIQHQSSFEEYTLKQKADLVITSPPYANCFDYSKVYLVELWFGGFFKNIIDQKLFRQSSITSHVHYKWEKRHGDFGHELINNQIATYLVKQNLWDKKIPNMLVGYFSDMGKVLYEMIPNLNKNATIGIVVGNSVYGGLPIATDILLAQIAIKLGFELMGIESYRTLTSSSQQLKIMRENDKKYLRESLIILKWN
jgi:DNA modification methylase